MRMRSHPGKAGSLPNSWSDIMILSVPPKAGFEDFSQPACVVTVLGKCLRGIAAACGDVRGKPLTDGRWYIILTA